MLSDPPIEDMAMSPIMDLNPGESGGGHWRSRFALEGELA
jgi:hypothetical protein